MGNKLSMSRMQQNRKTTNNDEQTMADLYDVASINSHSGYSERSFTSATPEILTNHPTDSTETDMKTDLKAYIDSKFDQKPSKKQRQTHTHSKPTHHSRSSSILEKMGQILKPSAKQINAEITEYLITQEHLERFTMNILLMGQEKSGKSVIFKQMEKALVGEIDQKQMDDALENIRIKIVRDMIHLCRLNVELNNSSNCPITPMTPCDDGGDMEVNVVNNECVNSLYKLHHSELQEICVRFASLYNKEDISANHLSKQLAVEIDVLWRDEAIQNTFKHAQVQQTANNIMTMDHTDYFLNKIIQIVDDNYVCTLDDYLRVQHQSHDKRGVSQRQFTVETKRGKYRFDVTLLNEQQSHQRRWSPYLDNLNVIVYVVNVSVYDQHYDSFNCLQRAMEEFQSVCNDKTFFATDFVVMFNKIDIFKQKIKNIPCSLFQDEDDFDGDLVNDGQYVKQYIMNKFKSIHSVCHKNNQHHYNNPMYKKRGNIYFHQVNDDDTEQIGLLLQTIQTDVLTSSMKRMGYVY